MNCFLACVACTSLTGDHFSLLPPKDIILSRKSACSSITACFGEIERSRFPRTTLRLLVLTLSRPSPQSQLLLVMRRPFHSTPPKLLTQPTLPPNLDVLWPEVLRPGLRPFQSHLKMSSEVGVSRVYPGVSAQSVRAMLATVKGLVLETFGAGNSPRRPELLAAFRGKPHSITTLYRSILLTPIQRFQRLRNVEW